MQLLLYFISILCLLISTIHGTARTGSAAGAQRRYLTENIYQTNNQLVLQMGNGSVNLPLGGWRVAGTPVGRLIALNRPVPEGAEIKVIDPAGQEVGFCFIPQGYAGIVTDRNIIAIPETLHHPLRDHDLLFYSLQGVLLQEITNPELRIAKWWPRPDGRMITVNRGPAEGERTIVVYSANGKVLWRFTWTGNEYPDVTITPDGARLAIIEQDIASGTVILSVLAPGNRVLKSHQLPNLYKMIVSSDSQMIAAVGQHVVTLVDAKSGNLVWRKDQDIDLVAHDGLLFDPASQELMVVAAQRDQRAGKSHLRFHRFAVKDGASSRTHLEDLPLDRIPSLVDIETPPDGSRRFILHNRILQIPASGKRQR